MPSLNIAVMGEKPIALEKAGKMVPCNLNAKGVRVLAAVKAGEIVV